MTTPALRPCCPHLGLNSDRTIMLMGPTMAHRCYVQPELLLPDPERQSHFCLTANHGQCPLSAPMRALPEHRASAGLLKAEPQQTTLAPALPVLSTQWVRVPQPPVHVNKANRILLPRRQSAAAIQRKPRNPLLLPAVSSYLTMPWWRVTRQSL